MKNRSGTTLILSMAVIFLFIVLTGAWGWHIAQPGPLTLPTHVVIQPGKSVSWIANHLEREGVIKGAPTFKIAVKLMFLDGSLQAGEYKFEPNISLRTVVNKLATGDVVERTITFPEGLTVAAVTAQIEAEKSLKGDILKNVPEGYLYPDTYSYPFGTSRKSLMLRMKKRAERELAAAWENRDAMLPLKTPNDLMILASIVEKETNIDAERTTVASVYINRLNKGMKLQADPTVIYGASHYNGNLTRKHLKENQPYNTYVHKGLPPTPIANPSKASMLAVARPAQTPYFYLVASGDGGHVFSRTYPEHAKNVEIYVRKYKAKHGS